MTHSGLVCLKEIVVSGKFVQLSSADRLQRDKAVVSCMSRIDDKCKVCLRGAVSGSYVPCRILN